MAYKINDEYVSDLFANGNNIKTSLTFNLSSYSFLNDGAKYVKSGRTGATNFPAWCNAPITDTILLSKYTWRGSYLPFVKSSFLSLPIARGDRWFFVPLETFPERTLTTEIFYNKSNKRLVVQEINSNNVAVNKKTYNNYNSENGLFLMVQASGGGGGGAFNDYWKTNRKGGGGGGGGSLGIFFINLNNFLNTDSIRVVLGRGGIGRPATSYPTSGLDGFWGEPSSIQYRSTLYPNNIFDLVFLNGAKGGNGGSPSNNSPSLGGETHSITVPNWEDGVAYLSPHLLPSPGTFLNTIATVSGKKGGNSGEMNKAFASETKKGEDGGSFSVNEYFSIGLTTDYFVCRRLVDVLSATYTGEGSLSSTWNTDGISEGGGGGASLLTISGGGYGSGGAGAPAFGGAPGVGSSSPGGDACLVIIRPSNYSGVGV